MNISVLYFPGAKHHAFPFNDCDCDFLTSWCTILHFNKTYFYSTYIGVTFYECDAEIMGCVVFVCLHISDITHWPVRMDGASFFKTLLQSKSTNAPM